MTSPDRRTGGGCLPADATRLASAMARSTACCPNPASPAMDRSSAREKDLVSSAPSISAARFRIRSASVFVNRGCSVIGTPAGVGAYGSSPHVRGIQPWPIWTSADRPRKQIRQALRAQPSRGTPDRRVPSPDSPPERRLQAPEPALSSRTAVRSPRGSVCLCSGRPTRGKRPHRGAEYRDSEGVGA
jgi:hypothetical protein